MRFNNVYILYFVLVILTVFGFGILLVFFGAFGILTAFILVILTANAVGWAAGRKSGL